MVKKIHLQCGRPGFDPWVEKIPWRMEPIPVFWPGETWTRLSDFHFLILRLSVCTMGILGSLSESVDKALGKMLNS